MMRLLTILILCGGTSLTVRAEDVCKVLLVDVGKADKEAEDFATTLGEFRPTIGEDIETTQHFKIPGRREYVTVTVLYTDGGVWVKEKNNSLLADSIIIGLLVSEKKEKSAFLNDGIAHLSPYRESTTLIQLSRGIRVSKKRFEIQVACWCNDSKPWSTNEATSK